MDAIKHVYRNTTVYALLPKRFADFFDAIRIRALGDLSDVPHQRFDNGRALEWLEIVSQRWPGVSRIPAVQQPFHPSATP